MRMFVRLLAILVIAACPVAGWAQKKELLKTDGYGSLSGKVTLDPKAKLDDPASLVARMMAHPDKACCLNKKAKPNELVETDWVIDKKTRAVANVVIWIKPPAKKYLEVYADYKKRKDHVVIDQPHCAYLPRVSVFNPSYFDGKAMVMTGQQLTLKNSAVVSHNVKGDVNQKYGNPFNVLLPPGTGLDFTAKINPQPLPIPLSCAIHPWMRAELYVFDHPYYAITKEDGTYAIPFVPAGAEVYIMGHHAAVGYVVNLNKGKAITIGKDKKHTFDFEVTK